MMDYKRVTVVQYKQVILHVQVTREEPVFFI